jgi:hypothetical protein
LIVASGGKALGVVADAALAVRCRRAASTDDARFAATATAIDVGLAAVSRIVHAAGLDTPCVVAEQTADAVGGVGAVLAGGARRTATAAIKVGFALIGIQALVGAVIARQDRFARHPVRAWIGRKFELRHAARRSRQAEERRAYTNRREQARQARSIHHGAFERIIGVSRH